MAKPLVPDELWAVVRPPLPLGPPRVPDRACLAGVLFVLGTGVPRETPPPELGCGSGVTCWRRRRDWQAAGAWDRPHRALLDRLGGADRTDRGRAAPDPASVPAPGRPRERPAKPHADTGDDYPRCRAAPRRRRVTPRIARRGVERSDRLGRHRWAVERTPSRLERFRRLDVRYERRADVHQAFLSLGCPLICWRHLQDGSD